MWLKGRSILPDKKGHNKHERATPVMHEQLFQTLMFLGSATVGVLGFFLTRLVGGADKTRAKLEKVEDRNESEIVNLKLTLERINGVLTVLERDMKSLSEDARAAAAAVKQMRDLQEDVIKNKAGLEAAWKAIEELRYDVRKRTTGLVSTRRRKTTA